MKKRKSFRLETIVTYLLIFIVVGLGIVLLNFININFTGFATFTPGPGEGQTTLTLQEPDTENLDDAYVDAEKGKRNRGLDTELKSQRNPYQRTYIKFDLSQIPTNQLIDNSQLCLYLENDQASQTVFASHVYVHDWDEGSWLNTDAPSQGYQTNITWENQPCGENFDNDTNCNLTAESSITNDGNLDTTWQCWTVTNTVNYEYINNNKNVSIILYTEDLGNADIFLSKEYTLDTSLRPYLNITYHQENQAPNITLVHPQNTLYLSNESLNLNFTVFDNDDNLDSCWYWIDDGINVSITNCANTTFSTSEGNHDFIIYANDSLGEISSDNVNFDVDATGVGVSITEPTGTKSSRTGIPINISVIGNDVSCLYNVYRGASIEVANTSISCVNDTATFSVTIDADFTFNAYANNSLGNSDNKSSSFSVSTSSGGSSGGGGGGGGSSTTIIQQANLTQNADLTAQSISNLIVKPGDSRTITWTIENTGTQFLNECKLTSIGSNSGWLVVDSIKSLAAGEESNFVFTLNVPEDAESGIHRLGIALICKETSAGVNFNAEILEQKLGFEIINVERESGERVKVDYVLSELSGIGQDVDLQFLIYNANEEKIAEATDSRQVSANSREEFMIFINIDPSLRGDYNLLVNLNSETYSTFIQENILIGSPTGFAIFGEGANMDNLILLGIVAVFGIFAFVIIRRIFTHRKKIKSKIKKRKK